MWPFRRLCRERDRRVENASTPQPRVNLQVVNAVLASGLVVGSVYPTTSAFCCCAVLQVGATLLATLVVTQDVWITGSCPSPRARDTPSRTSLFSTRKGKFCGRQTCLTVGGDFNEFLLVNMRR